MGRVPKRRPTENYGLMNEQGWAPAEIDNDEKLTLFTAVCQIVEVVSDSRFNPEIFKAASRPIAYVTDMLGLTEQQAVVYAIVMHLYYDRQISTMDIGRVLNIPPLKAMIFSDDLEALCKRKFLIFNLDDDAPTRAIILPERL